MWFLGLTDTGGPWLPCEDIWLPREGLCGHCKMDGAWLGLTAGSNPVPPIPSTLETFLWWLLSAEEKSELTEAPLSGLS